MAPSFKIASSHHVQPEHASDRIFIKNSATNSVHILDFSRIVLFHVSLPDPLFLHVLFLFKTGYHAESDDCESKPCKTG